MTRRFGGSGLGLAICAPLAQAMGGAIEVDTAPARGSTFTLTLPVKLVAGSPMLDEAFAGTEVGSGPDPALTLELTGHVLLAEDGYDNQQLISTVLRRQGFQVTIVTNGLLAAESALGAAQDGRPFDVVLMDMQMPELDGYGATARLRASGYAGPIIALTAHAMSGERERCLAAGCNEYLSKPIDRNLLIRTVSAHIREQTRGPGPVPQIEGQLTVANDAAESGQCLVSDFAMDPDMRELVSDFVRRLPAQMRAIRMQPLAEITYN
jgi:CheY-like chemotaxis protein